MLSRYGRSPCGAFIRSPCGQLTRANPDGTTTPIPVYISAIGLREDNPFGTALHYYSFVIVPPNLVVPSNIGQSSVGVIARVRFGFSLALAGTYPVGTVFTLNVILTDFNSSPAPKLYLSSTDDHTLYSSSFPRLGQDWELHTDILLASGLLSGVNSIDIPYATLLPHFGQTVSFLLGEHSEFNDIEKTNRRFELASLLGGTVYPYLVVQTP